LSNHDALATCSITELGFVRVLVQAPQYRVPISSSLKTLQRLRKCSTLKVIQLPDQNSAAELPSWVKGGRQITDGHLFKLAVSHNATLATLDEGIPSAFLIPPET
jgi:hypothetical protein